MFLPFLLALVCGTPLAWVPVRSDDIRLAHGRSFLDLETAKPYRACRKFPAGKPFAAIPTEWCELSAGKGRRYRLVKSRLRPGLVYLLARGAKTDRFVELLPEPSGSQVEGSVLELLIPVGSSGKTIGYVVARDSAGRFPISRKKAYQEVHGSVLPCDSAGNDGLCSLILADATPDNTIRQRTRCIFAEILGKPLCVEPPRPQDVELKPMVYLYPERAMDVDVELDPSIRLTSAYPVLHDRKWRMSAAPGGRLVDRAMGREYYGLFWESQGWAPPSTDTGVVVRGADFAETLDSLLERKGLDFREREEFVTFWLPRMGSRPWVAIRFQDRAFASSHPVHVEPGPDVFLRVFAVFQGLDEPRPMVAPVLSAPERRGFVAVEWGGKEIDPEVR